MKLAIDLQSCLTDSRDRGIGRYSLSLATHLASLAGSDDVLMLMDGTDPERLRTLRKRLREAGVDAPTAVYSYPSVAGFTDQHPPLVSAAGLLKSRLVETTAADVILVTSLFETGSYCSNYDWPVLNAPLRCVIAYDIIPLLFPDQYLPPGEFLTAWYHEKVQSLKSFDLLLAISEATRRDLIEHLGIPEEKVRVIGAGLDHSFLGHPGEPVEHERDTLASLGIDRPFVLMVGNADWRKNSLGALEIFAALPSHLRERHQLVFTRVGEDVHSALRGPYAHVADDVLILGSIEEQILCLLYKHCDVFFFPSLYEGFGLPVIEAMALGAPVLTSSLSSLHEIVHDSRVLFDPRDKAASVEILQRALESPDFRRIMSAGAAEHAKSFTWDKCATLALSAMREKLAERNLVAHCTSDWAPNHVEIERLAGVLPVASNTEAQLQASLERIANGGRRRILVDMSEVIRVGAWSGIQRVVRNIFKGLCSLASETGRFHVEAIHATAEGMRFARTFARDHLASTITGEDEAISFEKDDLLLMLDSSWLFPQRFEPLYDEVRAVGGEIVWAVYDLVPILMPQVCDAPMGPVFSAWLESVAAHADGCVCISRATEHDLAAHFKTIVPEGGRRPWTRHFHLGSDLESGRASPPSEHTANLVERLRPGGYCLALSTVEPRKDYPTILAAFERLWANDVPLPLIIVGKQGWNVDAFAERLRNHEAYGQRLFWFEQGSDGDVAHLIRNATCLVQASLAEGFGLAVVEAGGLGVPLFLSDLPVFREIAGEDAVYFPAGDHRALTEELLRAYRSGEWRSPKDVVAMSWAESSRALADILLGPVAETGKVFASSAQCGR